MKSNHGPSKEEVLEGLLSPPAGSPAEFRVLASPFRFGSERSADALAIDSVGRLTLVFLGQKDEEPWLFSLLDAFSWIERHRPLLVTRFHLGTTLSAHPPRLVLAAPDFSKEFCARLEALRAARIDLLEWEAVEIAGERKLVFRRIPAREKSPVSGAFPEWALDAEGAAFFREAVEKISKIDPEIALDWGPGSLDLRFRGRLLGSLLPGADGLRVRVPSEEEPEPLVADRDRLTRALDRIFREYVGLDLEAPASAGGGEEPVSRIRDLSASSRQPSLSPEELEAIAK